MSEYMSLKVSSAEHADLAIQLTTLSTQGWNVVNIVSTGTDLIAYLSRVQANTATSPTPAVSGSSDSAIGWATAATQSIPAQAVAPAKWYPDPSGRYEYRYWDGAKWTDDVSRAGIVYKDPPIP